MEIEIGKFYTTTYCSSTCVIIKFIEESDMGYIYLIMTGIHKGQKNECSQNSIRVRTAIPCPAYDTPLWKALYKL